MSPTVLLAEDDPAIAQMVTFAVRMVWPHARVNVAAGGAEALRRFAAEQPDVVMLDVTMPPPDGMEVCRRIRQVSTVPILMLTVRAGTVDKVRALDAGADDYLTKPFEPLELLARLRALLRRARAASEPSSRVLTVGDVTLDQTMRRVHVQGAAVRLTSTEYRLLEELMRHAGRVLPHRYLLTQVWGPAYSGDTHLLRVFVRRLRRKLGDDTESPRHIQTEWNAGYRFIPAP